MFKFDEICELIRLVGSSGVSAIEIEHAGSRLRIDGSQPVQLVGQAAPAAPSAAAARPEPAADTPSPAAGGDAGATDDGLGGAHEISSPIVGTFYRAPNPDAEPYVRVGDAVRRGQVLCIVEAMKLMNEIESDVDGTIVKVHPENAEPVEYGERLFSIRPA